MTKKSAGSATSTPACSSRVPILPIRYAVVPNANGAPLYRYANSGFNLEKGFAKLTRSSYTLRALRPGYVYVFMKGPKGEKLVIHEYDGEGQYQELTYGGLEDYDKKDKYKKGTRMGWVWADTCPDTAREVWVGYSPHLWTNAMTAKMATNPSVRQRHMRPLDMAELTCGVKSPSGQAHVLPASALVQWVEDFKPRNQRLPLEWSSHTSEDDPPISTFLAQANHYRFTQPRVPVVIALNDAEGLCQDLGLSVSAYQHQIRDLMPAQPNRLQPGQDKAQDDAGIIPDCFRLNVEVLSAKSQDYHHKNMVALLLEKTLESMYPGDQPSAASLARLREEHQRKQVGNRRRLTASELHYQVTTDENISPAGGRLGQRIDTAKFHAFLAERNQLEKQLRVRLDIVATACSDHDKWLATAEDKHRNDPNSLAAAIASYDRDELISARGLETSLALMIHPMSQALPGTEDEDPRFQRLGAWLDQLDSPLYLALAPFNPFKDQAAAVGTLLGAADNIVEGLAGRFPAMAGVTDLTAQAVTTVVLKRIHGKTRWDASRNLRQQVLAAAREAHAEKAMGLLGARYRITDRAALNDVFSKEVDQFLKSGMEEFTEIKRVRVTGSRTVTIEQTVARRVRPNVSTLLTTSGGGVLNVGMVWFNLVNLKSAYASLQQDSDFESFSGFGSAIFGLMGAVAATLVSVRAAHKIIMLRLTKTAPGLAFGNGFIRLIGSNLFTRLVGYPAILIGFTSDVAKSTRQIQQGDGIAAGFTFAGGVAVTIGSAAILEGSLAVAGATAFIPFAGWAAAAVVLLGAGVLAGGLALHAKAKARTHQPIELWAARSVFGNRQNDGEVREGIKLDAQKKLPPYAGLTEEIKHWYAAGFAPALLEKQQLEALGLTGIDSRWHDDSSWITSTWGVITMNPAPEVPNVVEFAILLRGYIIGQSHWTGTLSAPGPNQSTVVIANKPTCHLIAGGLVIHFKSEISTHNNVILNINYNPNLGLDKSAGASAQFGLER